MAYEHQEYPKWKYHKTEAPKIVHTPEAEAELGEGWKESPADHAENPANQSPATPSVETYVPAAEVEVEQPAEAKEESTEEKAEDELREELMAKGFPKKKLKGLSKAELISLNEE